MAAYRFYPRADAAQDDIWRYTLEQWGEAQAEIYIRGLHTHLARLAEDSNLWHPLPPRLIASGNSRQDAFFSRYAHHLIFFRVLGNGDLGIMSILHERMDIPVRLMDDLSALAAARPPSV